MTEFSTIPEVARRLALSEQTVRRLIREGELPAIRIGDGPRGRIRVRSQSVDRFVEQRSIRAA